MGLKGPLDNKRLGHSGLDTSQLSRPAQSRSILQPRNSIMAPRVLASRGKLLSLSSDHPDMHVNRWGRELDFHMSRKTSAERKRDQRRSCRFRNLQWSATDQG